MGNDAGDDFGKFPLEDKESTSRVLDDEFGKRKATRMENGFLLVFSECCSWVFW